MAEAAQTSSTHTAPASSTASSSNRPLMPVENQGPIHPFANILEAQYVPLLTCNFAAPADKGKEKEKEPAYHTIALIQNTKVAEEVYKCSMKTSFVMLSPAELLLLSPEY